MNRKNILSAIAGAFLMGISMSIAAYIVTGYGASFLWQLGVVFAVFYGAINGAIAGGIIEKYDFNFIQAAIFGLLFNIAIGVAFLIFTMGNVDDETYSFWYASIIIGAIIGGIISLVNRWEQRFK